MCVCVCLDFNQGTKCNYGCTDFGSGSGRKPAILINLAISGSGQNVVGDRKMHTQSGCALLSLARAAFSVCLLCLGGTWCCVS